MGWFSSGENLSQSPYCQYSLRRDIQAANVAFASLGVRKRCPPWQAHITQVTSLSMNAFYLGASSQIQEKWGHLSAQAGAEYSSEYTRGGSRWMLRCKDAEAGMAARILES